MNILHLTSEFPPYILGGLGTHVTELTKSLSENENVKVTVCSWKYPTALETTVVKSEKVDLIPSGRLFEYSPLKGSHDIILSNFGIVRDVLNSSQTFDLIHAHDFPSGLAGLALKEILRIPLVVTFHDTIAGRTQALNKEITQFNELFVNTQIGLSNQSDAIITVSNSLKSELCNLYNVCAEKVTVITNGINQPTSFKRDYKMKDDLEIVFVGRFVPEKGLMDLIDAVEIVKNSYPEIKLKLIGKLNQYSNVIINKLQSKGLENIIEFKGFLSGRVLENELINSDISVVPSHYEPFGIVALESCVVGLPTIITDVGGLSDIIKDKVTGLKVPSKKPEKLAEAIIMLIGNEKLRQSLGERARKNVVENYLWSRIAKQTFELYKRVLEC